VLVTYAGNDASIAVSAFSPSSAHGLDSFAKVAVLILPVLLSILLLRHSMKGSKQLMNVLPAVAVGLTTAILVVPILPSGVHASFVSAQLWPRLAKNQEVIVIASSIIVLVTLWLSRFGKHPRKKY
jgi:hypothetical protein